MDRTIADYTDGGALQSTDQLLLERSGAYQSVTGGNVTAPANAAQIAANNANTTAAVAFSLAVAGTNAAHEADSWGRDAFSVAVNGTNAANQVATVAGVALSTAWTGTNAANEADSWARDAYSIATTGTSTANAALSIAITALAYTGTSASGSFLPLSGGTLSGNIDVPNVQVGYGTLPWSSLSSGTMFYDFNGNAYTETTMSGNGAFQVSAKNMAPGREIAVLLVQSGQSITLTYDPNISFYGANPPSSISNKNILLALTSRNFAISGVIGASSTQQ